MRPRISSASGRPLFGLTITSGSQTIRLHNALWRKVRTGPRFEDNFFVDCQDPSRILTLFPDGTYAIHRKA